MFINISSHDFAFILLTVACMATFLSIFYFTYTASVEKEIITKQMNYVTNNLLDELNIVLPDEYKGNIYNYIKNINPPNMEKQDFDTNESNKKIIDKTLKIVLPGLFIALSIVFIMSKQYNFSFMDVFFRTFLTIIIVAIVEFLFLNQFASKYISANANLVKYNILSAIQNNL